MFKGRNSKSSKSELWFFCFANCIMVIYICMIKFQEHISNSFQFTEWTQIYYRNHYFQSSKGSKSKSRLTRVTVLVFCTSSHDALHLCEVHQNIWNGFQLTEQTQVHSKIAIFKIYYVQSAATPKTRLTRATVIVSL